MTMGAGYFARSPFRTFACLVVFDSTFSVWIGAIERTVVSLVNLQFKGIF